MLARLGSVLVAVVFGVTATACARGVSSDAEGVIVAERIARIGQMEGAPEYAFGQIWTLLPAADGGFYACDGNDMSIRRYDSAGVFVTAVGRKGKGPGEYLSCSDLALGRGGELAVSDPSNGRIAFFKSSGEFDRVVEMRGGGGLGGVRRVFFIDVAGRMWKRGWVMGARSGEGEAVSEDRIPIQYVIHDPAGVPVDSMSYPRTSVGRTVYLSTNDGAYTSHPSDTIADIGLDGTIAAADPMTYRITLRGLAGDVRTITRVAEPISRTGPEQLEWEAWRDYVAKQQPSWAPPPVPTIKPLLRELQLDEDGRLWVKVHVTAEQRPIPPRAPGDPRPLLTWRERNTFDLFDASSGAYRGRVAFPYATVFLAARGDRVWLREEGEGGEHVIGVYRLTFAATAP